MHGEADSSDDAERTTTTRTGRSMPSSELKGEVVSWVTLARDVSYGPETKDLIDIFTADKGVGNRTVLIYVPGGAGNKLEQQSVEANAFYDNIGRWAAENGMVGVTYAARRESWKPGPERRDHDRVAAGEYYEIQR